MAGTIEALLHFDGANGSTSIVDATGNHTWTGYGGTFLTNANSKFGPTSITSANIAGDGTINWGTNDWTVDCWIYFDPSNIGVRADIFYPNNLTTLYYDGAYLSFYNGGVVITGTTAVTANVWHHVALTKSGSTHYLFLDGQLQGTWVNAGSYGVATASYPQIQGGTTYFQTGSYQDELRILMGAAAWTANFTPPTSAYIITVNYPLPAALGTFAFTGIAAGSLRTYVMSASTGVFAFTGVNANLVYSGGLIVSNGRGMPVVTVLSGGIPVVDVSSLGPNMGAPVSEAAPGRGIPVTKVSKFGTPVVYI